jgi:hypothetical protein
MGCAFIDLDGTIFKHGTNSLLPGAQELLESIENEGHEIIFTTRRGDREFKDHPVYNADSARLAVRGLRVDYKELILDVSSPRVVINDQGAVGINHLYNNDWSTEDIEAALYALDHGKPKNKKEDNVNSIQPEESD